MREDKAGSHSEKEKASRGRRKNIERYIEISSDDEVTLEAGK